MTVRLFALFIILSALSFAPARCEEEQVEIGDDAIEASATEKNCDCNLPNQWVFLRLKTTAYEHTVPSTFTIDTTPLPCNRDCVVFDRQPEAPEVLLQGNWTIERSGVIRFQHRPHKTGEVELGITIQEISQDSDYIVNATYRIDIREEADNPVVFVSQRDRVRELENYNNVTEQYKNVSFTVEQNTGNNTVYADLTFTAGVFDYDANERHTVHLQSSESAFRGIVLGLDVNSSAVLLEPEDCEDAEEIRLLNRSITEWDTSLLPTHPCYLMTPYPPPELTWFTHLIRYIPNINQSGIDWFGLTYTDKYRLESKLYVIVYILKNPCVNDGVCRGPSTDPQCKSRLRANGFFESGYRCQCLRGWVGDRCETDFDDCSSSPCPAPYVCRDKFRGFECVCPPNLVNCDPILLAWQLAAMFLGIFSVICIVAAVIAITSQSLPSGNRVMPEPVNFKLDETMEEPDKDDNVESQFESVLKVDQATSPPPDSRQESPDSTARMLSYQQSYTRSSFIFRPSNVPSQLVERFEEASVGSADSDADAYEMNDDVREEKVNELRRVMQSRKILSRF